MRHAAVVLGLGLAILATSSPVAAGRQQPAAAFRANGLPLGRYTTSVVAMLDSQPVGRGSRTFEVVPVP